MSEHRPLSSTTKLALLASLYFSQGLPYGFFTQALPVWMRQSGMDLGSIGLSGLLALPWALKFLWAPIVDRHGGSRWGRRRGWILPLQWATTLVLVAIAVVGDGVEGDPDVSGLLMALAVGMLVTNFLSATQDIPTDGLAVDLLTSSERGLGNGVQVAAYRVGMVVGGFALLSALNHWGWLPTFWMMGALVLLMTLPIFVYREPPAPAAASKSTETVSLAAALEFLKRDGGRMSLWCLGLAAYKVGDAFGSPMARTLLVDKHYSVDDIAWMLGLLGSAAGMVGAMLGGSVARRGRLLALVTCGLVHAVLMASYALPVFLDLDKSVVAGLVVVEHITGGMATVALFTAMMDAPRAQTSATDYTVQACVVVIASGVGSNFSGFSAQAFGYAVHFVGAGVVCVAGTLVMIPLYRAKIAPRDPSFDDELKTLPRPTSVSSTTTAAVAASQDTESLP